mmetsp:Transcript_8452/g.35318  ORF Transcript_8452/g.35318 Transcript_8452/m.35318 type:complete len:475 (-) Transcript_8452:105-1529(-)
MNTSARQARRNVQRERRQLVWPVPLCLELHLQAGRAHLEAVHVLDRNLRTLRVVEAHEAIAAAEASLCVSDDLGAEDGSEGREGHEHVVVGPFVRHVSHEEVRASRPRHLPSLAGEEASACRTLLGGLLSSSSVGVVGHAREARRHCRTAHGRHTSSHWRHASHGRHSATSGRHASHGRHCARRGSERRGHGRGSHASRREAGRRHHVRVGMAREGHVAEAHGRHARPEHGRHARRTELPLSLFLLRRTVCPLHHQRTRPSLHRVLVVELINRYYRTLSLRKLHEATALAVVVVVPQDRHLHHLTVLREQRLHLLHPTLLRHHAHEQLVLASDEMRLAFGVADLHGVGAALQLVCVVHVLFGSLRSSARAVSDECTAAMGATLLVSDHAQLIDLAVRLEHRPEGCLIKRLGDLANEQLDGVVVLLQAVSLCGLSLGSNSSRGSGNSCRSLGSGSCLIDRLLGRLWRLLGSLSRC